jgi:hypothetical protein
MEVFNIAPANTKMLPGYHAGWFWLRNGDKALLYLTDRSKAVYVQTTEGYGVMVSPSEPEKFVAALNRIATR